VVINQKTLGVVLAGGRSSRMGKNKALMMFEGQPLVEHMINILKGTGVKNIKISGEIEGYDGIADETSFEGPAKAIEGIIQKFSDYSSFLFVPVDMPFLSVDILRELMQGERSAYYKDWPLPAFVIPREREGEATSVRYFMQQQEASIIPIPPNYEDNFININTPEEWSRVAES
jgi:molybdopterin-guanine dinucleotide biosynthesis protein A